MLRARTRSDARMRILNLHFCCQARRMLNQLLMSMRAAQPVPRKLQTGHVGSVSVL